MLIIVLTATGRAPPIDPDYETDELDEIEHGPTLSHERHDLRKGTVWSVRRGILADAYHA